MLTDEQEFIEAAVLGELYWKTSKGPKLSEKLKEKWPNFKQEEYQDYIDHIKNLIQDPIRTAGFGGWNKDITEKDIEEYKKSGCYDEFVNTCKEGKIKFVEWYLTKAHVKGKESRCCYCGISEKDLSGYFNEKEGQGKKACERSRGPYLEIERIVTYSKDKKEHANLYNADNCALACYICNNAKSDFISPKDFKPIAEGINKFWQEKLKDNQNAVEDLKVFWEYQKDNKDIFRG